MRIFICIIAVIFPSVVLVNLRSKSEVAGKPSASMEKTQLKAGEALRFCKSEKFNTDFCILVDMSLHSGVKRLFVWDFLNDTIANSFLVGHGCCDNFWSRDFSKDNPGFSNEDGSHCSSLGKYKIGERAYSDWGINIKYLLHGLEKTKTATLCPG